MIAFTQSDFQYYLAKCYRKDAKIYRQRGLPTFLRYLNYFWCLFLYFRAKQKEQIVVHDYRNPLLIIFILLKKIGGLKRNLFIGDDGFHSLIVDRHGLKFLYYNVGPIKKFFIERVKNDLFDIPRVSFLKQEEVAYPKGSNCFSLVEKCHFEKRANFSIFVDQQIEKGYISKGNFNSFLKEVYKDEGIKIACHPLRFDNDFADKPNITSDLVTLILESTEKIKFYGFFSTALLIAQIRGHQLILHKDYDFICSDVRSTYIKACVEVLKGADWTENSK